MTFFLIFNLIFEYFIISIVYVSFLCYFKAKEKENIFIIIIKYLGGGIL